VIYNLSEVNVGKIIEIVDLPELKKKEKTITMWSIYPN